MYKKIAICLVMIGFIASLIFINSISTEQGMQKLEDSNNASVDENVNVEDKVLEMKETHKEEEIEQEKIEPEEILDKEDKVGIEKEEEEEKDNETVNNVDIYNDNSNEQKQEEDNNIDDKVVIDEEIVQNTDNSVIQLSDESFEKEILQSNNVAIVDFYADWCGPCQLQSPIIEEIAKENTNIKVGKVDVDKQTDLAIEYSVIYIPTLIIFKDGKEVDRRVGITSKEDILSMCR